MEDNQYRFVHPIYHWFVEAVPFFGTFEGTCLLATLQKSADMLMMTLTGFICLNTTFYQISLSFHWPFSMMVVVLVLLKNDARI